MLSINFFSIVAIFYQNFRNIEVLQILINLKIEKTLK